MKDKIRQSNEAVKLLEAKGYVMQGRTQDLKQVGVLTPQNKILLFSDYIEAHEKLVLQKMNKNMEILDNYIPYEISKKGVFRILTNKYDITQGGWIPKLEERIIIGETDDCYIHRLLEPTSELEHKDVILPIGIHKSYFLNWMPNQLQLF